MSAAGGMAFAGGAVNAKAAIMEGQAAAAAAEYNEKQALDNANLSRLQSAEDVRRLRVMARKQIGSARAASGASGVALDGSALDVLEESAANAELDALTLKHQGDVKAYGFESDARLERFRKRSALEMATVKSAAALLGAGGQAAGYQSGGGYGKRT